ncbi:MAG TPA: FHA domain-containing protein, partial [Nannocystis sp.]
MIICPNCGKENQDHYKFCLGCGARLPGAAPSSVPPRVGATPAGTPASAPGTSTPGGTFIDPGPQPQAGARAGTAPSPAAQPTPNTCSACGMVNPVGFLFCGRCGTRLAAAPSAPPPAAPAAAPVAAPTTAAGPSKPKLRAYLHLLREDGSDGGTIDLEGGPIPFGRDSGPPFDQDYYLNPKHCAFTVEPNGVRIDDLSPVNGVYRKIEGRVELQHGDTFRVGQELLYYEDLPEPEALPDGTERMGSPNPGYWGRISVIVDGGRACEAMPIVGTEFVIGRERGDLTFPTDGYVSSTHCRIGGDDEGVYLEDRGSSNGTYLRVRSGQTVPFGSLLLIGQQLFHVRQD